MSTPARKILVVDDEEGIRDILAMVLKGKFDTTFSPDGDDALEQLKREAFDIVLSDMKMPKRDGYDLLKASRALDTPPLFIMMSAFADIDSALKAMKEGAVDYIPKPFKNDEVVLKLELASERLRLSETAAALERENKKLRAQPESASDTFGIVGKSEAVRKLLTTIEKVAPYRSTVLLLGESGTGKELAAKAVHAASDRSKKPFVAINCGAIPETLLESELFGHVKGAFTDATRDKRGLVEEAEGGTLFLDEIAELPAALQVKLLRFLQEDEIRPVGSTKDIKVDVRVIGATAKDLGGMVAKGTFREDLFYRLNVLPLQLPSLRDRRDDIPMLAKYFVDKHADRFGKDNCDISADAMKVLVQHEWPGNVRELENAVERALIMSESDTIESGSLPERIRTKPTEEASGFQLGSSLSIKQGTRALEQYLIKKSLAETNGNRTKAAELLELSHRALLYKLKEYGIK